MDEELDIIPQDFDVLGEFVEDMGLAVVPAAFINAFQAGQRVTAVLIERLGGSVEITEEDLASVDLDNLHAHEVEEHLVVTYGEVG